MTFYSPFAEIEFDVPLTASHENDFAKLVRANALGVTYSWIVGKQEVIRTANC
jgi:hypothetical protein